MLLCYRRFTDDMATTIVTELNKHLVTPMSVCVRERERERERERQREGITRLLIE